jgi:hypothetical protein
MSPGSNWKSADAFEPGERVRFEGEIYEVKSRRYVFGDKENTKLLLYHESGDPRRHKPWIFKSDQSLEML